MFNPEASNPEVSHRILEVARKLFVHKGFKGTSVREIAAEAGTNVAMVNYYFSSKYSLFERIFEDALGGLWQRVFESLDSEKPFFELIEQLVDSYYDMLMEHPEVPIFLLNEVTVNPGRLTHRLLEKGPYPLYRKFSARIEEEVRKGTIRETPPLDFLLNLLSLCIFPFIFTNLARPLAEVSEEEYDKMLRDHRVYVTQFIIQALKPDPK